MTPQDDTNTLQFCRLQTFLAQSGMSSSTFYRKVQAGVFHPRKDVKTIYVDMAEVREWYAGLKTVQEIRSLEAARGRRSSPTRP